MAKRANVTEKAAAAAVAPAPRGAGNPIEVYGQALDRMYKKDWAQAVELFERVVAESDEAQLTERARQFLAASRQRLPGADRRDGGPEDPFLKAVYEKNRGHLDAALAICRQDGRDGSDDRFAYLTASIHALENRTEEAARALSRAVELNSKNRIHAYHDTDFAELRRQKDHAHLFGLA